MDIRNILKIGLFFFFLSCGNEQKEYFKSGLLMALESTMSNMLFLGEQASISERIQTKDQILKDIKKVDADMIKDAATKLFSPRSLKLAVIGPQMDKEALEIERLFVA